MGDKSTDLETSTFTSLVLSLSSTAWIGLGKIADPINGKVKMDLNGAKYSIDVLIMLRNKTKGNLTENEQKLLNGAVADLQANYAEIVFSGKSKGENQAEREEAQKNDSGVKETEEKVDEESKSDAEEIRSEDKKTDSTAGINNNKKNKT